jgi:hypothetical protein
VPCTLRAIVRDPDADRQPSEPAAGARLVFIGGLHRSGTTLLADLLGEHPDVSSLRETGVIKDEGQFLQDVYPRGSASGGPGRFAHGQRAHLIESDAGDAAGARQRLLASWTPYWDTTRPVWVEKSPPNLIRFRYLQQIFPDATFVAIVRHPVAVAYATQKWSKGSIARLIRHWVHAHEQFEADRPQVRKLVFVRYEDLVRDAKGTLAILDAALGIAPHAPREPVRQDTNERYLRRWWQTRFVPAGVRVALNSARFERRIQAIGYGYSLRDRA